MSLEYRFGTVPSLAAAIFTNVYWHWWVDTLVRKRCTESGGGGAVYGVREARTRKRGTTSRFALQMTDEKLNKKKNYVVGNVKFNKMIRNITEI